MRVLLPPITKVLLISWWAIWLLIFAAGGSFSLADVALNNQILSEPSIGHFLGIVVFDFFSAVFVTHDSTLRRNEMRSTTCGLRSARLGRRHACCNDVSSNGVFARDFSHATMPTRRFHTSALPPRVPPWRHYEDRRRTT